MKVTKLSAGMTRTIQGAKQFENFKPHTGIEIELENGDNLDDAKHFLREQMQLWSAEMEHEVLKMKNGLGAATGGGLAPPPYPGQLAPPASPQPQPTAITGDAGPYASQGVNLSDDDIAF